MLIYVILKSYKIRNILIVYWKITTLIFFQAIALRTVTPFNLNHRSENLIFRI